MEIRISPESAEAFIERAWAALVDDGTRVYIDTSFLMWLTTVGPVSRNQFFEWAATLGDRVRVPVWAMHEYYKHHTGNTLKDRLQKRVAKTMGAAKAFLSHVQPFTDQPLMTSSTEAEYREQLREAVARMESLVFAAKAWDAAENAAEVIGWMNNHACESNGVFDTVGRIRATGESRFTQNVPPGFEDRYKKAKKGSGSNAYGDLLFWEEIIQHAKAKTPKAVVIISNDRKRDWYFRVGDADVTGDLRRLRSRWDPVPSPHPTLAYEIHTRANVKDLILLDDLYLGAVLWANAADTCARFADVAIGAGDLTARQAPRPAAPEVKRSAKRRDAPTIGLQDAKALIAPTLGDPDERVAALLEDLAVGGPERDALRDQLMADVIPSLTLQQLAMLAKGLHDRALADDRAAEEIVSEIFDHLDEFSADQAAGLYLGVALSAYFDGLIPRSRPAGPFLDQLFYWQDDTALTRVLKVFSLHLTRMASPSLYRPNSANIPVKIVIEHDALSRQVPAELSQVSVDGRSVLVAGEAREALSIRNALNGQSEASMQEILRGVCTFYGLPLALAELLGGEPSEARSIPELIGFQEFDRFDAGPEAPEENIPLPQLDDEEVVEDGAGQLGEDEFADDEDEDED